MPVRVTRLVAVLFSLALVAAACSGGDDDAEEAVTTTAADAPTTTAAPVDDDEGDEEVEETTTTVPVPTGPTAPLTGVAIESESALDRPALAVKIDNHPRARPQTGIEQADLVFEVRAEGVTRFLAIFHSMAPEPLGPVRSSRTSDFEILTGLNRPLYASSGGNDYVAAGLRQLDIQEVTAISRTEYFRDGSRPAPHNLYVNADDLWALAEDDAPPEPWFLYRQGDEPLVPSADPIEGAVTITYRGSPVVTHTWDEDAAGWLRTQDGRPHTTITGDQLAPENVVIMSANYTVSPADTASPEVQSVGSGDLFVLTQGHVIQGTWSRLDAVSKPQLLDSSGQEILLTPGRTWVLMPDPGSVTLPLE